MAIFPQNFLERNSSQQMERLQTEGNHETQCISSGHTPSEDLPSSSVSICSPSLSFPSQRLIIDIIPLVDQLEVLGSLVTIFPENRKKFFMKKCHEVIRLLLSFSQLHLQAFLLISRMCISSRLVHLLRTLSIDGNCLEDFDEVVSRVIFHVFKCPPDVDSRILFLPFSKGGCGFQALADVQVFSLVALR